MAKPRHENENPASPAETKPEERQLNSPPAPAPLRPARARAAKFGPPLFYFLLGILTSILFLSCSSSLHHDRTSLTTPILPHLNPSDAASCHSRPYVQKDLFPESTTMSSSEQTWVTPPYPSLSLAPDIDTMPASLLSSPMASRYVPFGQPYTAGSS